MYYVFHFYQRGERKQIWFCPMSFCDTCVSEITKTSPNTSHIVLVSFQLWNSALNREQEAADSENEWNISIICWRPKHAACANKSGANKISLIKFRSTALATWCSIFVTHLLTSRSSLTLCAFDHICFKDTKYINRNFRGSDKNTAQEMPSFAINGWPELWPDVNKHTYSHNESHISTVFWDQVLIESDRPEVASISNSYESDHCAKCGMSGSLVLRGWRSRKMTKSEHLSRENVTNVLSAWVIQGHSPNNLNRSAQVENASKSCGCVQTAPRVGAYNN